MAKIKIAATVLSIRALGVLLGIVIALFAAGKWGIISPIQTTTFIEGTIIGFGALILIIETFREARFVPNLAGILAVITILLTSIFSVSKFLGIILPPQVAVAEAPLYSSLSFFVFYEIFIEGRKK